MTILYCGDTSLQTAAAYLAGVMHHAGLPFDYVPSDQAVAENLLQSPRSLYVFSDLPAVNLTAERQRQIVAHVGQGSGLLMIGGWESFHGIGGSWDGTPIGNVLPVEISATDDRVNCDHPVLLVRTAEHPAVDGLPWESRPPVIGGFNRVKPKAEAEVVLEARHFTVRWSANETPGVLETPGVSFAPSFTPAGTDPLLVFGAHGRGRVGALMTDVAPHWVGPLVDWGDDRVTAQAPEAGEVEVGNLYVRFLTQLLAFLAE